MSSIKTLTLILFACLARIMCGQGTETLSIDSAVSNIDKQFLVLPQEKIYLHTDKPYYISGEKIFFRIFLLDIFSNRPTNLSQYVYVELINPVDSVVTRLKIRPENEVFSGTIPISAELPQGIYKIRAYTRFMLNQGEGFFYSQYVRIGDPQVASIQTETKFNFDDDKKIGVSLRFVNSKTQEIIKSKDVILRLNKEKMFSRKSDDEGWARVKFDLPVDASKRVLFAELKDEQHLFRQYIRIPYPEGPFDVSFYPEGGHLVAGQMSYVAFKAVSSDGTSLEVSGEIVDAAGDTVFTFETIHDGMGYFAFEPKAGATYHAICRSGDKSLSFDLPEVRSDVLALKAAWYKDKLWISVNKSPENPWQKLYLLIHSGGAVIYAQEWNPANEFITFNKNDFPSGISHVLLLSENMQALSERLVFALNEDQGLAHFQTAKNEYKKRELVQTEIQLKDEQEQPLSGTFSISVTDDSEVLTDTSSNIVSGILLSSELKGYIDNPAFYFQKGNKEAAIAADLLMMTHGWNRYDIPSVVLGNLTYPTVSNETGQELSGTVKGGLFSKPIKDAKVMLLPSGAGNFDMTLTDENGRFSFQNFETADSTKYFVQALSKKGGEKVELYVDRDTFPGIKPLWVYPTHQVKKSEPVFLDYVAKSDKKYTYENGLRTVQLKEVQVSGSRANIKYKSPYYLEPDNFLSEKEIETSALADVSSLLQRFPGITIYNNIIRFRNSSKPPVVMIDGMMLFAGDDYEVWDNINSISVSDIAQLDIIKNVSKLAIFGSRGANGVISIHTKRGDAIPDKIKYNIETVIPLGYQKPVAFYSPKYDTKEAIENKLPDLRTTIYWQPDVKTGEDGKTLLDFYTADDPTTYSVIIEGVSKEGKLIHYSRTSSILVK